MGIKVIINGCSSSGKSTAIDSLKKEDLRSNWIHFGIDSLWDTLSPEHLRGSGEYDDNYQGFRLFKDKNNSFKLYRGPFAQDLLKKIFLK